MKRQIISVSGRDADPFLQAIVTNDVARARSDGIVWAALLTPQGKYLADFFIIARPDGLWLDVDAAQAGPLLQRLAMYRLRSQVDLHEVAASVTRGTGPKPPGALPDPRHPALGWRLYGEPADGDGDDSRDSDRTDWDALRVAHLVPEAGRELIAGESFILEAGFERLNGVDFHKGCYIGQEITARMKHKTTLRKGLVQVGIHGEAAPGAPILTADGREAGWLGTQAQGRALAYLRFDRIGPGLRAGQADIDARPPGM